MERLDPFRREKKLCKLSVQCDTHHLTDSLQSGFSEEGGLHESGPELGTFEWGVRCVQYL